MIGGLVATIGYTPFFLVLGLLDLVGAAVLWMLVREPRREALAPEPARA
jgi:ACS family hexuronate transporter-like MFS transporter